MEIILALVGILVLLYFIIRQSPKSTNEYSAPYKVESPLDVNKDGKVNLVDVKAAVTNIADVNKDGKVDAQDAKEVATKVTNTAKKAATKAKTAVAKAKKPAVKKAKPAKQV